MSIHVEVTFEGLRTDSRLSEKTFHVEGAFSFVFAYSEVETIMRFIPKVALVLVYCSKIEEKTYNY